MNGRKIELISSDVGDKPEQTAEMTRQDHVSNHTATAIFHLYIQVFSVADLKLTIGDDEPTLFFKLASNSQLYTDYSL